MTWRFAQVTGAHSTSNYKILAGSGVAEFDSKRFLLNYFSVARTHIGGVLKFVGAVFVMRNRDLLRRESKPGKDNV
jgi:hypothetical protein